MKRVVVLGSTGSIGRQALEVCRWRGYRVVGLAAGRNLEELSRQIQEWRPLLVAAAEGLHPELKTRFPWLRLAEAEEVAALEAEVAVAAIPGLAGLAPTRAAVRTGKRVALANKEAMVAAGPLLWQEAEASGAEILPVDSEHAALFQALLGERREDVAELILTASGGPFLREPRDLSRVTPEMALNHPRWRMGPKVTVDSATLFNKGLEALEAKELFRFPLDRVKVLVHPQAYVHGLVRFVDGSLKAQLGPADMRLPIQYALTYPERGETPLKDLPLPGVLEFLEPDTQRFPALEVAYAAGRQGGVAQAAVSAADEVAVAAFLAGRLPFPRIPQVLARVLEKTPSLPLTWDNLFAVDAWAREEAKRWA
ncbi:1-deoxy-D-xylulose-5-phosphate reductoisomerase [Thermus thermamylovorans]|uniref:1-deoxy-D-xylulose 5-phosphate reductoisomerase n=1 Tax=Thermus thermamylovorans TaxID=2509362 RepID=A0A4Q9B451_9DEIN|nr:1-deoxy-D-xylulose-5-phosphate reductoisomerase [Thermus thermamylovorans]TBH20106.1 1-deoxy-D-xylulose-5-phosphate reductoisomerase [Thermus thermamylovorans]